MSADMVEYSREEPESILKELERGLPGERYIRDGLVIRENSGFLGGKIVAGLASREGEAFGSVFAYRRNEFPEGIEQYLENEKEEDKNAV